MAPNNTRSTNKPAMSWVQVASSSTTTRRPAAPSAQAPPPARAPAPTPLPPAILQVDKDLARGNINAEQAESTAVQPIVPSNALEGPQAGPEGTGKQPEGLTTTPQGDALPIFGHMTHAERLIWAFKNDALLVSIDVEKYMVKARNGPKHEHPPTTPPEIGISISDPLTLPTASRLDLHQRVVQSKARHVRVKEVCHLTNPYRHYYQVCQNGCEDCFLFGQTEFASTAETARILREMLMIPRDPLDPKSSHRPVALFFHDARGDTEWLREFNFDLTKPEFAHAFIIDTQKVADRRSDGNPIGLKDLLAKSGIGSDHCHNSGNDAFRTLVAGLIEGIRRLELQATASSGSSTPSAESPGQQSAETETETEQHPQPHRKTPAEAVENFRQQRGGVRQFASALTKGDPVFCNRCHSSEHLRADCCESIRCRRCGKGSHMTEMCVRVHVQSCRLNGVCPRGCWRL